MSTPDPGPGDRPADSTRRRLLQALGLGVTGAAVGVPLALSARSLWPNALYEAPRRFKAGRPEAFTEGATFLADQRVFVFREGKDLFCLSAVCTHLGCTVQQVRAGPGLEFHCPCHGSRYRADGTNYSGPAPKPLAYHPLELAPDDGQVVVDLADTAEKARRLKG